MEVNYNQGQASEQQNNQQNDDLEPQNDEELVIFSLNI
jgi:hypothetical protein